MPYTELHARSFYSFLHGASSPEELIQEALSLGLNGLALTDLGGVYGLPKAYQALKEKEFNRTVPFNLISGTEIPLLDYPFLSIVLLAKNRAAYGAMCRILTESHRGQPKGVGGLQLKSFVSLLQTIPHAQDLILLIEWQDFWFLNQETALGTLDSILVSFHDVPQLKYLTLSRLRDGFDDEKTKIVKMLSSQWGVPVVATQGVRFHAHEKGLAYDVLTSVREGKPLSELGLKLRRNGERHLKSAEEMESLFSDFKEAIYETEVIRKLCSFCLSELKYVYPSEWIPVGFTAQTYLEHLCKERFQTRYPISNQEAKNAWMQLQHELKLISELKFADYFLTVFDIVSFAERQGILCQGRGSAANSVVCYVLGVTAIDPIRSNLLFERFLSVERGEPPDIDVDFEHERREEVIQYLYEKYGRHRAAMVATNVTYRERSVVRDVTKAFSLSKESLGDASPDQQRVIKKVIEQILGFPRHLSIHSGGFTLSADRLDTLVPIEPATMEGRTIIQWDKNDLDILGLLKIDVLALGMLTAIQKNLKLIGKKLHEIPAEDEATYNMICKADTMGVFQIESRAQMSMLPRLKPRTFYDLVVEVALVRPGPIVGNMVHPYLKRRRNQEKVWLPDPRLIPILGRTYGVPIFQEQIMKIAIVLAGFTPGEADQLRRAIGAWRSSGSMDRVGARLRDRLKQQGIPDRFANQIFEQIKGFSEYGFPESHAASFALITYASCYLKCHYPAEFLCALLNSQPLGFYSPHSLIDDAKRHGVEVFPIHLNQSFFDATLVKTGRAVNAVQLGFRSIRGLNEQQTLAMIEERTQNGPFVNFQNFISRTHFDLKSLRVLARAGAFQVIGLNPREALFKVLALHDGLFAMASGEQGELFRNVSLPKMNREEEVIQDYQAMGLSAKGHPMSFLREKLVRSGVRDANNTAVSVKKNLNGSKVKIPGLSIVLQRPPTAKGTAFATLEDETGVLDLILHKEVYEKYRGTLREESFLWVSGILQRDGEAAQVIVSTVSAIFSDEYQIPIAPGAHARRA